MSKIEEQVLRESGRLGLHNKWVEAMDSHYDVVEELDKKNKKKRQIGMGAFKDKKKSALDDPTRPFRNLDLNYEHI